MAAATKGLVPFVISGAAIVAEARAAVRAFQAEQHTLTEACPRWSGGCGAAAGVRCAPGCKRAPKG
ncbi:hypothetical protein SEA_NIKLAS_38 [Mycobacterium Phage Niklas]|uniref:Uncharacterized protein n=1 Tax=Mycobacterium Phage Niklas TaxID=2517936 RepID=A0A482JCJ6_9CAUD|nr:hypothetical protein I5H04_gp65 [Mycobacterium Phage Niklas]ASR85922.1 hypothetical protein SEA_PEANAM_38 [Mycobacterium phage Peanam]QAY02769.1 hypothetical protein SEA_SHAOBING_38 [Mycobacterium phage Shaobing]QBP31620.1 hypothetical protein SEA_NIKLAS_38 [Mycobacterium Phage Niklas]